MLDPETFLVALYVMVDDFCQEHLPAEERPPMGRPVSLCRSEVLTLALFGQWYVFPSERAFYRWASRRLRSLFPSLPDRSQFNRLARHHAPATVAFMRYLARHLGQESTPFEAIDTTAVAIRNIKRRGLSHLPEYADIGYSRRLGFFYGFHLLLSVTREGVITGFGLGPASAKDQPLAEAFFAARHTQPAQYAWRYACVGHKAQAPYMADTGFQGEPNRLHWRKDYGATVICKPQGAKGRAYPKPFRRWIASLRQIVETVNNALLYTFGLWHERPHDLDGCFRRIAERAALHNASIDINQSLGRPNLAFADLIAW